MIPTPKTDDIARGNHVVPTELAQELERENARLQEALVEADDMLARIESEDHGSRSDEITVLRGKINSLAFQSGRPTQLQNGVVPAGKRCPYANECPVADTCPTTRPSGFAVAYSCGLARGFDIAWRPAASRTE